MARLRRMQWISIVFALFFATAFAAQAGHHEQKQKVVVHLSHFTDDLHAVSMALALATNLQKAGAAVTLFLDLEGARLADARLDRDLGWGSGPTVSERFGAFVEAGGSVVVCAHCAKAAGLDDGKLRKGARIGADDEVGKLFLGADNVVDY